ncbi:MAG: Hpt domain-containing protein [Bacteroidota bacterium]
MEGNITKEYLDEASREGIIDLMDGDAEMIVDLIDTLIETSPDLLSELEEGISGQNGSQIRDAAHALKSSNAQLGALDFAKLCLEAETMGKMDNLVNAEQVYQAIKNEFAKVEAALNSWKSDLMQQV